MSPYDNLLTMNCFQLIKSVLDESFSLISAKNDDERFELIESKLESLSDSYTNVENGHAIDYSDPVTRFAYIYRYTVSHASMVAEIIGRSTALGKVFEADEVNISCVGGGPGSDFLGIIKYCLPLDKKPSLELSILDKNPVWGESWSDIRKKTKNTLEISPSFLTFDVTKEKSWRDCVKHLKADLFTMIYFMSEIYAFKDESEPYLNTLFSSAKSGAVFLFLDNWSRNTYKWFDTLAEKHGLEIIKSREEEMSLPFSEQCSDLGVYYDKLSYPKIRAKVAYRIARKK